MVSYVNKFLASVEYSGSHSGGLSSTVDVNIVLYSKTGKLYTSGNKNAESKYKLYENNPEEALVPFGIWKVRVVPHSSLFSSV